MKLCVKIGGALLENASKRKRFAACIARAHEAGTELLIVHGGGRQIADLATRLGLVERRHEGLRITDRDTARVVQWVLAGEVNKCLVDALTSSGVPALGLCGADLGLVQARRKAAGSVDLGFVGELTSEDVDADRLRELLAHGYVPVLGTIAPERGAEPGAPMLNVNADEAAGPLATAAGCEQLLFLSDVPGVKGEDGTIHPTLSVAEAERLIQTAVVRDGMIPKVRAAICALAAGVPSTRILSGEQDDPIAAAAGGDGTEIHP